MRYPLYSEVPIVGARQRLRLAPAAKVVTTFVREENVRASLVVAFLAAHVPLAILMSNNATLATLHAFLTLGAGLSLALFSDKVESVAYPAAYITGAEVLWRMTDAQLFWEIGKYGVSAIFIIAMIRHWRVRPAPLPVVYFLLLLPSSLLTIQSLPLGESRLLLSSTLSGPFSLMVAGCYFSQAALTRQNLLRIFLLLIGPVIGIATVAALGISSLENIVFTNESNFDASGGFGPNQVSSILGVGALVGFLLIFERDVPLKLKILFGGVMLFFSAQGALTFSRGGLYNVVGAIALASLFLLKDSRTRIQFILAVILFSSVAYFLILPRLDSFTKGALSARFEDTEMTGREEIVLADLQIWSENLILGVGPGVAKEYRAELGRDASAHTEFTRLLAEHGVFGLAALFVFAAAVGLNVLKARTMRERAIIVAISGWSFLYMLNAATRLVAPSLMLGLAFVSFIPSRPKISGNSRKDKDQRSAMRLRPGVLDRKSAE